MTKTEQIKTGYSNVNDYSKYLQGKYHYVNTGTTSMQGVPTTVSVSSAFLQKCMNDPEKAKYLEENLAAIPDCAKSAVNGCLGTLTNLSYKVDENGNISVAISGTNDPDGKIAKENAERKVKENRIILFEKYRKRRRYQILFYSVVLLLRNETRYFFQERRFGPSHIDRKTHRHKWENASSHIDLCPSRTHGRETYCPILK